MPGHPEEDILEILEEKVNCDNARKKKERAEERRRKKKELKKKKKRQEQEMAQRQARPQWVRMNGVHRPAAAAAGGARRA